MWRGFSYATTSGNVDKMSHACHDTDVSLKTASRFHSFKDSISNPDNEITWGRYVKSGRACQL